MSDLVSFRNQYKEQRSGAEATLGSMWKCGDRVVMMLKDAALRGTVRYCGPIPPHDGTWIGVELDVPEGKTDGSCKGVSYFKCSPRKGVFVRPQSLLPERVLVHQQSGVRVVKGQNPTLMRCGTGTKVVGKNLADQAEATRLKAELKQVKRLLDSERSQAQQRLCDFEVRLRSELAGACHHKFIEGLVVTLNITGTIVERDLLNDLAEPRLTTPARGLLKELTQLDAKVVYLTLDDDWAHAIEMVKSVRESPVAHKFLVARHASRPGEFWAFRMEPPSELIDWSQPHPRVLDIVDRGTPSPPTSFERNPTADHFRLTGMAALQHFVTALLLDGDVVLRMASDPGHSSFLGREEGGPSKVLAVNSSLPCLVFDACPDEVDVLTPSRIVKVVTPFSVSADDDPTCFVHELRDHFMKNRLAAFVPRGVVRSDCLVLKMQKCVDKYAVLWLGRSIEVSDDPSDEGDKDAQPKRELLFREVSLASQVVNDPHRVRAVLLQTMGNTIDIWSDTAQVSVDILPADEPEVNKFLALLKQTADVAPATASAAAALTVETPTGRVRDIEAEWTMLRDRAQQAMVACSCPATVHAVCRPKDGVLLILLAIRTVGDLHQVCDKVLHENCDLALKTVIHQCGAVDKTEFARIYHRNLMQMDELTEHQKDKLGEMLTCDGDVHLMAPAGGGKTFVGLHFLVHSLDREPRAIVMYAASNPALCSTVVLWIMRRRPTRYEQYLPRVLFWCPGFDSGPRRANLDASTLTFATVPLNDVKVACLVVDEAHHLYCKWTQVINDFRAGASRTLLLSDRAQCESADVPFPKDFKEVHLQEVVRSTRLIVNVSTIFQNSEEKSISQHNSGGPPVKSYVFEADEHEESMALYAENVSKALHDILGTFRRLDLSSKVMIVCPDDSFVQDLNSQIRKRSDLDNFIFELAADNATSGFLSQALGDQNDASKDTRHRLILDTVEHVDGLERLIVIAVGLDKAGIVGGAEAHPVRSKIYRGITRAQMMAVIVQQRQAEGLLEFLCHVKLKDYHDIVEEWAEKFKSKFDDLYRRDQPKFTEEDRQRHNRAVDDITKHTTATEKPVAIFMAGGPGSGKGFTVRILQKHGVIPPNTAHLDCDFNRRFCPLWLADTGNPKSDATAEATQVEAGLISELAAVHCVKTRRSFIYDGTLRNVGWNLEFMKELRRLSKGALNIAVVFVDTRTDVAEGRVEQRREATGRPVPFDVVINANRKARQSVYQLEREPVVSLVVRIPNNGDLNDDTVLNHPEVQKLLKFTGASSQGSSSDPDRVGMKGCGDIDRLLPSRTADQDGRGETNQDGSPRRAAAAGKTKAAGAGGDDPTGAATTSATELAPSDAEKKQDTSIEQVLFDTTKNTVQGPRDACVFMPFEAFVEKDWWAPDGGDDAEVLVKIASELDSIKTLTSSLGANAPAVTEATETFTKRLDKFYETPRADPLLKRVIEAAEQSVGFLHDLTNKALDAWTAELSRLGRQSEAAPLLKRMQDAKNAALARSGPKSGRMWLRALEEADGED